MDITQTFYDQLASQYDKLFEDWNVTTHEQAVILDRIFRQYGFGRSATVLDCACGIGTQSVGLAALGYRMTASDISDAELAEAAKRAAENEIAIRFAHADFCALADTFSETFDVIICMDNALPHMLSHDDLASAIGSITGRMKKDGIFVASIRDYDTLLMQKPPYSPPYIHKTAEGQRVSFQVWTWEDDRYKLIQYIIDDGEALHASKFACEYRATTRAEITDLLRSCGCSDVKWLFPEESGFYQPIVVARKQVII